MKRFKRIIALLTLSTILIGNIPSKTYAISDNGNSGSGSQGGSTGGAFTWVESQGGYRIYIVDNNMNKVSNTVDLLFSTPTQSFGGNRYTNPRNQPLSTSSKDWSVMLLTTLKSTGTIGSYPKYPVEYSGNTAVAQGELFKEWFMAGKSGMNAIVVPPVYTPPASTSGNTSYNGSYGTSKPDKVDTNYGPAPSTPTTPSKPADMAYVSGYMLVNDYAYRASKRSTSASYVLNQGHYTHARSVINSVVYVIKYDIATNSYKYKSSTSLQSYLNRLITSYDGYLQNKAYTQAEYIYMYTSIINEALGTYWTPAYSRYSSYANNNSTTQLASAAYSNEESNTETLESIPLASGGFDGYADNILDYKSKDKYLFYFTNGKEDSKKLRTELMSENSYTILVEPIFWFKPAGQDGGYPSSPYHTNYIYGTVANIIQFYKATGNKFGTTGGAYAPLTSTLGYKSLYTSKNWGNGNKVLGLTDRTGTKTTDTLYNMLNQGYGLALHVYTTSKTTSNEQVTGEPKWEQPAAPPDPSKLKEATGYSKEYNIVKYYEDVYPDGKKEYPGVFYGAKNPHVIKIQDEMNYKVKGWFITNAELNAVKVSTTYDKASSTVSKTRTGTGAANVKLREDNGNKTEKTLVVLLQRSVSNTTSSSGPLDLTQSQISKLISTSNTAISGWGKRNFTVNYAKANGGSDKNYNYTLSRIDNLNAQLEASKVGGVFASSLKGNTKSGTVGTTAGSNTISGLEYKTVIWRGLDIPTIASYKVSSLDASAKLTGRYGKEPKGNRAGNGSYNSALDIGFELKGDISTYNVNHVLNTSNTSYKGNVAVNVYRGLDIKEKGEQYKSGKILTTTPFGGSTSIHSHGNMIRGGTPLQFYPYVKMTYQDNTGANKDTYVLSQWYSQMNLNSFVEVAWASNAAENVALSSVQWSLHAKAIEKWGKNNVLPGGSIYQLSIPTPVQLNIVTWQPVVTNSLRDMLYNSIPASEYSLLSSQSKHEEIVRNAASIVEDYRLVQYVNKDTKAKYAWSGTNVKITDAGQSLSSAGLGGVTSSEDKYRLLADNEGNPANQGDIDVVQESIGTTTYFKVLAAPNGDVYLAKSVGDIDVLANITGTNPVGTPQVTVTKLLSRADKATDVSKLTGDARDLETRTYAISNLLKTLERNTGDDKNASWGAKWYNESFDSAVYARQSTILSLGFKDTATRTAAIDTALVGKSTGTADMFSKAVMSQFRLNSTSDSFSGNASGYIGSFGGVEITIPDVQDMFSSKKIYVPNVSASDLD